MKNGVQLTSWQALKAGMASTGKTMLKSLLKPTNLVIVGATAMIAVLYQTNQAIEDVRDRAGELGDAFNSDKSDIEGYKEQIDELHKTINDSGSSLQEVTTARQTLMAVQDELIDKFGDEKETIDLVTQAIYGQSSALDELIKKQWQEAKNDFNESDIWNDFANWREGYSNNIDRMVDEMENAWGNIKMSTSDYFGGEYNDIIQRLEKAGWEYSSAYESFIKGGSTEDIYEEILEIQTLVGDDMPDNFLKSLTEDANKLKSTLDNYESMWDNYILNDKIFADDNLADNWKEINDAYTKYQSAVASGDKTAIEEATSGFATSINEVLNNENVSNSVKDYFKDMYPALYREVEKWEFKTNIIPEFDTSNLQGKTQADVLEMLQTEGTQDGESTFNSIIDSAIKYGLILDDDTEGIQKILDLLVEWGILQDSISDETSNVDEIQIQWSLSEDQTKAIDDFKSKLKDLSGYLEKSVSGTLTDTDLSELLVDFPSLTSETDNLTYAIKELMYGNLDTLLDTLGEDAPVELVNALRGMADESYNFAGNVDKLQSDIGELNNVLASVRNGEAMNAETMTDLISRYEGLDDAVIALSDGGYSIEEDALIDLMNSKIEESNTAISVQIEMTERTIEQIKKRIEAYKLEKEALAGYGNMASLIESGKEGTAMDIYGSEAVMEYQALQDEQAYFEKELADLYDTYKENTVNKQKSSKSSNDDPWKDAFDAELKNLKHNLEMEYITEKQYYDDLEKLNNKYFAGRTEYLDEYRQYEEEVYKGLKDYYKDYVESNMDLLEKQLDAGVINYAHYSSTVKSLLDNMFADGKISAEDYHSYIQKMTENQLKIYEKALSAILRRYDTEISKIEKSIEAVEKQNEAFEKQKTLMENASNAIVAYYDSLIGNENESIESIEKQNEGIQSQIEKYDSLISVADKLYEGEQNRYQTEIDNLQEKIDLINEESDALDLQLRKEQALYALQQAQNQRTKKVLTGNGFIYQTDNNEIRDAQNTLQDIQTEELINSLEKEKEALQESIDALQEYRDALSEIGNAYSEFVDKRNTSDLVGQDYEKVILGTTLSDWTMLKDAYIKSNEDMANNDVLIKSHEERISTLEEQKNQWSSLSSVIDEETQRQAATQLFGADWEAQINEGRLMSFDEFKNNYLLIDSQINSNEKLIESYEEKVTYYEGLKKQWSDISDAYEQSMEDQYATMLLGQNWETEVLNGRLNTLNEFKKSYTTLQQQIANAAWNSANEQIKASQEAQKAASGLIGSAGSVGDTSSTAPTLDVSKAEPQKEKKWHFNGKEYDSSQEAYKAQNDYITNAVNNAVTKGGMPWTQTSAYSGELRKKHPVEYYHTGLDEGYVGNSTTKDDRLEILRKAGSGLLSDEVPTILKRDELVLTTDQQQNIVSNLLRANPNMFMPNVNVPQLDFSMLKHNDSMQTNVNIGEIHMHEVQNVADFGKELQKHLPTLSVQFRGKH